MRFQRIRIVASLRDETSRMFDALGEPEQVLDRSSPRPLVVHDLVGQVTFVAGGEGLALLDGQMLRLAAGDLLLISPGCTHAFGAPEVPLVLRHWHWPPDRLAEDRRVLAERIEIGAASG